MTVLFIGRIEFRRFRKCPGIGDGLALTDLEILPGRLLGELPTAIRRLPARDLSMSMHIDGNYAVEFQTHDVPLVRFRAAMRGVQYFIPIVAYHSRGALYVP